MKKFLSLVLALVMTMSLVTVASAADFTDDASINYDEAVAVIEGLGIVNGYADGSFKPTNTLTRGAAAKIICNLILTPAVADTLEATAAPFKDVPADSTFAAYIAYCAQEGIINGYADGTFRPSGTLTTNAFMKMLLGALGLDGSIEGYTGANWGIQVAQDVADAGLAKGNEDYVGSAAITREEACLYAFNTLNAYIYTYGSKGTTVTINGAVISTGGSDATKTSKTFGGETYKNLTSDSDKDAFGRDTITWYYGKVQNDDTKIGTFVDEAALSYTGTVKATTIWSALSKATVAKITEYSNSATGTASAKTISKTSTDTFGGVNTAVEVYTEKNDDGSLNVEIVTIAYTLDKVTKVNDVKYDKYGDVKTKANIVLETAGTYETTGFAKGDMVLVAKSGTAVKEVILADSVEGTVASAKSGKLTINGTTYANTSAATLGSKGTFYLGVDNTIVGFEGTIDSSDDYAYIYNVVKTTGGANADGYATGDTYTAYVVLADGTKATYVVDADVIGTDAGDLFTTENYASYADVICYAINSDGELTTATAATTGLVDKASVKYGKTTAIVAGKYSTSETDFVFAKENATKGTMTVSVVTGYTNVAEDTQYAWVVYNTTTNKIETIFVEGGAAADTVADKDLYVLMDAAATTTIDASDEKVVYTYTVQVNGKETTLSTKDSTVFSGKTAGYVFTVTLTNGLIDKAADVEGVTTKAGTVTALVDTYAVIGGTTYYFADDCEIYLAETEDGVYSLTETALAKDDVVAFTQVGGTGTDKDQIAFVLATRAE